MLLVGVVVYGTAGYIVVEGWGFLDALYMTILTLTTVGYKEVHPLEGAGQVFTITVLVAGVSVLLITLSMVIRAIEEGGLGECGRRKTHGEGDKRAKRPRDRVWVWTRRPGRLYVPLPGSVARER